jgi:hypothetical protein
MSQIHYMQSEGKGMRTCAIAAIPVERSAIHKDRGIPQRDCTALAAAIERK